MIRIEYYDSPVGELVLGEFNEQLCMADWRYRKMRHSVNKRLCSTLKTEFEEGESAVLKKAKLQLREYFEGTRMAFDIPLLLLGSDFQKGVWNELMTIRHGETKTYLDLSKKLGDKRAIRAVAAANGANAISIIVPCHRIIGNDGSLIGYAGGLNAKKRLLQLEKADVMQQISLF